MLKERPCVHQVRFLLTTYSKMQEGRNYAKLELLTKRKAKLKGLVKSQPSHSERNKNECLGKDMKGVVK